jgi:hypothetical protein
MKYRSVKAPPVCGSISLKDSVKSARSVRGDAKLGAFKLDNKKIAVTKVRNRNGSRTSSKAVGKR